MKRFELFRQSVVCVVAWATLALAALRTQPVAAQLPPSVATQARAAQGGAAAAVAPAAPNPIRQLSHTEPVVTGRETPARAGERAKQPAPRSAGGEAAGKIRLRDAAPASANAAEVPRSGSTHSLAVVASLSIVLGLFFVVVWFLRRSLPNTGRRLPNEVVELLGYTSLAHRQQVQLLRLGNKLLLISMTPTGAETLTEVSDPAEVERLVSLSRKTTTAATTAASPFRQIFDQFRRESAAQPILAKLPSTQSTPKPGQERSRAV